MQCSPIILFCFISFIPRAQKRDAIFLQCGGHSKDSQVFCKWTNKIQGSTTQPLKTLKLIELTWTVSGRNVIGPFAKKLENLLFLGLTLWLDNIVSHVLVWVSTQWIGMWKSHHFLMKGIQTGYLFCSKWHIQG